MKAIILAFLLSFTAIGAWAAIACTTPSPANTSITYAGFPSQCATNNGVPCLVGDTIFFSAIANGYSFGCEGHNYFWDFGDGSPGSGQSVMHTYTGPGTYAVTLTLTSEFSPTLVLTQIVNVAIVAPATSRTTLLILMFVLGAIAVVHHVQQRNDNLFSCCLPELEAFAGAAFPEIVEFCEQTQVFVLLFLDFFPELFQLFFPGADLSQIGSTRNVFISIHIIRRIKFLVVYIDIDHSR